MATDDNENIIVVNVMLRPIKLPLWSYKNAMIAVTPAAIKSILKIGSKKSVDFFPVVKLHLNEIIFSNEINNM